MLELNDADLLEFAKSVELTATEILEGLHLSARGGEGVEFHSSLPYVDGEDARRIDWKRLAATDRYFINRFEREEKTSWTILIDRSKSMAYEKKTKTASLWAGVLIFLAQTWGDRWRLLPDIEGSVDEAFRALSQEKAGVESPDKFKFETRSSERLVVLSDFFWETEKLKAAIHGWKAEFSRLHLLQILDSKEMAFQFSGVMEFRDLESSDRLVLDSNKIASRYRKALNALQEVLQSDLADHSFAMTVEASPDKLKTQLMEFFEAS